MLYKVVQLESRSEGNHKVWSFQTMVISNRMKTVEYFLKLSCGNGRIFISFVFPQFISFHSVLHSFHGLMNLINWPASSVWVFIAQLVEHCSASAEVTGSNPVEAPKNFFFGLLRNCLNCDSTAMVAYSFQCLLCCRI